MPVPALVRREAGSDADVSGALVDPEPDAGHVYARCDLEGVFGGEGHGGGTVDWLLSSSGGTCKIYTLRLLGECWYDMKRRAGSGWSAPALSRHPLADPPPVRSSAIRTGGEADSQRGGRGATDYDCTRRQTRPHRIPWTSPSDYQSTPSKASTPLAERADQPPMLPVFLPLPFVRLSYFATSSTSTICWP